MTLFDAVEWQGGTPLFETNWRAVTEGLVGNGIVASGDLQLSASATDLAVDVAAGDVWYNGATYNHGSAATVSLAAADANPRWDLIYFDTADTTPKSRDGTPFDPSTEVGSLPDLQDGEVVLGMVEVPANATDVGAAEIYNWRVRRRNATNTQYDDSTGTFSASTVNAALDELQEAAQVGAYPLAIGDLNSPFAPADIANVNAYPFAIGDLASPFALPDISDLDVAGNDLVDAGTIIWDTSAGEVPQSQLGGPAASLTSYPLPIGDLNSPFALPNISDMDAAGNDLVDGATTIWNTSAGYVPRTSQETDKTTTSVSTDTTTSGEEVIFADSSGNTVTITLASADAVAGREITIKDSTGSAGTNIITVATEGAETIDGATDQTLSNNYDSLTVVSDGTNWLIVGQV